MKKIKIVKGEEDMMKVEEEKNKEDEEEGQEDEDAKEELGGKEGGIRGSQRV